MTIICILAMPPEPTPGTTTAPSFDQVLSGKPNLNKSLCLFLCVSKPTHCISDPSPDIIALDTYINCNKKYESQTEGLHCNKCHGVKFLLKLEWWPVFVETWMVTRFCWDLNGDPFWLRLVVTRFCWDLSCDPFFVETWVVTCFCWDLSGDPFLLKLEWWPSQRAFQL